MEEKLTEEQEKRAKVCAEINKNFYESVKKYNPSIWDYMITLAVILKGSTRAIAESLGAPEETVLYMIMENCNAINDEVIEAAKVRKQKRS